MVGGFGSTVDAGLLIFFISPIALYCYYCFLSGESLVVFHYPSVLIVGVSLDLLYQALQIVRGAVFIAGAGPVSQLFSSPYATVFQSLFGVRNLSSVDTLWKDLYRFIKSKTSCHDRCRTQHSCQRPPCSSIV